MSVAFKSLKTLLPSLSIVRIFSVFLSRFNLLATKSPIPELAPPIKALAPTYPKLTSPYKVFSLKAASAEATAAPVATLANLPALATFAQGIKKVTGSAIAVPILPLITVRSSFLPLNSG